MSSIRRVGSPAGIRLDVAIDDLLASPIEPTDRVELAELQAMVTARTQTPGGLQSLLLDFIMPRLSDPSVLVGDRHCRLIEETLRDIDDSAGDRSLRASKAALRREMDLLSLIRRNHNSLVEG